MGTIARITGLTGVAALLLLSGCGSDEEASAETEKQGKRPGLIQEAKHHKSKKAKKHKKLSKKERRAIKAERMKARMKARAEAIKRAMETPPEGLSADDQKTWRGLKKALDSEDYREVRRFAEAARNSPSVELRSEAVSALSWFGSKGLATLTGFLNDADETVAQSAQSAWESGIMEIEDDATKLAYLETAMGSIENEEMLDALSQNFNQVSDETAAVESMLRVIAKGGVGAEKAKEAYAFMTGDEWTNVNDASKWIREKRAEAAANKEE